MSRQSEGFLAIWAEPPAGVVPEYLDWLVNEHLPERVTTPGFRNGRIFEDAGTAGRFLVVYDTETAEVLGSPAYLARGEAPTEWTQRMVKKLNPIVRGVGRIAGARGRGWGGAVAVTRFDGADASGLLGPDSGAGLAAIHRAEGVVAVRLLVTDPAITGIGTAEKRLRPIADAGFAAALVIEAVDLAAARNAQAVFEAMRAAPAPAPGGTIFARLRFGLSREQAEE